jgi:septal ring factor EnvC (AmiA/AmiB activator)
MGMNMPSCPGQQAMQKQIDDLSTHMSSVEKTTGNANGKVTNLEKEVTELKNSLGEVAEVLKTHKATIEQLQAQIQDLSARASTSSKKPAPKRKR